MKNISKNLLLSVMIAILISCDGNNRFNYSRETLQNHKEELQIIESLKKDLKYLKKGSNITGSELSNLSNKYIKPVSYNVEKDDNKQFNDSNLETLSIEDVDCEKFNTITGSIPSKIDWNKGSAYYLGNIDVDEIIRVINDSIKKIEQKIQ